MQEKELAYLCENFISLTSYLFWNWKSVKLIIYFNWISTQVFLLQAPPSEAVAQYSWMMLFISVIYGWLCVQTKATI